MSDRDVLASMARGSHFERALAEAGFRADDNNLARIKAAFPEIWREHSQAWTVEQILAREG